MPGKKAKCVAAPLPTDGFWTIAADPSLKFASTRSVCLESGAKSDPGRCPRTPYAVTGPRSPVAFSTGVSACVHWIIIR